jgi:tetratricopeptide (TPR) repeat protein
MEQHQKELAPPLSQFRQGVPPRLERLVARLLAKDRAERIGYARDVAAILSECGARSPGWKSTPPPERTYLYRPPLVGRDDATGQLDRALRRLWREHGDIVLVEGESGVGKTRFAMEIAHRATQLGVRVIAGGCACVSADATGLHGARGAPLHGFRPLLMAVADACMERGPEEASRLLGPFGTALAEFEPALRELCGPASPLPALPAAAARTRLYQSLGHVLCAFSRTSPVLLVMDDLQWADELSLGFLQYWAQSSSEPNRVLLLTTLRREERTEEHARFAATPGVRHISLPRLRAEDVGQMVAGMLSLNDAPAGFIRFLSRTSEGNPFFVAEYLRTALHERVLVRDAGKWRVATTSEPTEVLCESLPLPQSLRAIVERRLVGLPGTAAEFVKLAAVAGREFDLDLLQRAGSLLDHDLLDALTELTSRQVVEPADDGNGFRFAHDKLREIPYSELPRLERQRLHRLLAVAMEARQAAGRSEPPAVLGLHWLGADEPRRASPYFHAAGNAALRVHALDQAVELFRSALSTLSGVARLESSETALLQEKLGDALAQKGAMLEAREAFEHAIEHRNAHEHVERARLHRKLGKTWEAAHDHQEELSAYDRAERELELARTGDVELFRCEWIQVKLNRTWVFYWQARIEKMNQILSEIEPHLEQYASPRQRSNFYQALVTRDYRRDRFVVGPATLENARRSVSEAKRAKDPVETALARFVLGFGLLFGGNVAGAREELQAALSDTRRLGNTTNEIRCLAYLLLAARWLHETNDTRAMSLEVLTRATSARMLDYVGLSQACLGWLHYKEGNQSEARRMSQEAVDSWSQLSFCYPFQWTALLTLLACQLGESPQKDARTAEQLLRPGLALLPNAIDAALRAAVDAYEGNDYDRASSEARRAVEAAITLGLL